MRRLLPGGRSLRTIHRYCAAAGIVLTLLMFLIPFIAPAQPRDPLERLKGFDRYIETVLKDWNVPGIGVGVVIKDRLVFAKGYGYRDYEKKLPVTPNTLYQIA